MKCSRDGCGEKAVVYFISAKQEGRTFNEKHLCETHGREFIAQYHSVAYPQGHRPGVIMEIAQLEVELLAIYEESDEQGIYLRDVYGPTRFFMLIGTAEAWALSYNLKHVALRRPLTHQSFCKTIDALGGRLQDVLVDDFDENANCYTAKLRIQQSGRTIIVDIRPSDAFSMAVVDNIPILILGEVMRRGIQIEKKRGRN